MGAVRRVHVEKKKDFAVTAKELQEEIRSYLGIEGVTGVRVLMRYDVENISSEVFEQACRTVFSAPPVALLSRASFAFAPVDRLVSVAELASRLYNISVSAVPSDWLCVGG